MFPRRRKSNFTAKCLNTFVAHCGLHGMHGKPRAQGPGPHLDHGERVVKGRDILKRKGRGQAPSYGRFVLKDAKFFKL